MKRPRTFESRLVVACVVAAALVPAAIAPAATASRPGAPATADSALGLSRTSVFSVPSPPRVGPVSSDPGQRPRRARAYPGAPPQVPHGVADFLPVTRTANACLDCHSRDAARESGAVPLPGSHYTDLRVDPGRVGDKPAGARYVCLSCHAASTDARPLVGNTSRK